MIPVFIITFITTFSLGLAKNHDITEYMKRPAVINLRTVSAKLNSTNEQARELGLWLFVDDLERTIALDNVHLLIPLLFDESMYLRRKAYNDVGKLFLVKKKKSDSSGEKIFNPERIVIDIRYRKAASIVIPYLKKGLLSKDENIRSNSAESLRRIGPIARESIPILIRNLNDKSRFVRCASVEALGNFGHYSRTAVPYINKLLNDNDEYVRWSAQEALKYIINKWHYLKVSHE